MRRLTLHWGCVNCFRNTQQDAEFIPRTAWIPTADAKRIRGVFEMRAAETECRIEFAYQVCNVIDTPVDEWSIGSPQSSNGMNFGTLTDITSNTNGYQFVRFGFLAYKTGADQVLRCCQCGGTVEYTGC